MLSARMLASPGSWATAVQWKAQFVGLPPQIVLGADLREHPIRLGIRGGLGLRDGLGISARSAAGHVGNEPFGAAETFVVICFAGTIWQPFSMVIENRGRCSARPTKFQLRPAGFGVTESRCLAANAILRSSRRKHSTQSLRQSCIRRFPRPAVDSRTDVVIHLRHAGQLQRSFPQADCQV